MKMKSRWAAMLLILAMVFCTTSISAWAAPISESSDTISWTFDDDGVLTFSGVGEISYKWRNGNIDRKQVKSVIIEEGITGIGEYAFWYCESLNNITIPGSVTDIGKSAFGHCYSLSSITIPGGVTNIDYDIFWCCNSLSSIIVEPDNENYCSEDGVLFNKNKTVLCLYPAAKEGESYAIPAGVTTIGEAAFWECGGLSSITIPETVTDIGEGAFGHCSSLSSITIPDSVTGIGERAFEWCDGLTEITIPGSVTDIGAAAFEDCEKLSSVTILNGVTKIGSAAFQSCESLSSITIPDSVTGIGEAAFYYCESLSSITLPNGITNIEDFTFGYCESLSSITIPNRVTGIGNYSFWGCEGLSSIAIPSSVTDIGECAFAYCKSLRGITIPGSVTKLGDGAFGYCESLSSITIPDSITAIGEYTFSDCGSLSSITIPDSVTGIGAYAFQNCHGLTVVNFKGNESQWEALNIGEENEPFTNAAVNYNYGSNSGGGSALPAVSKPSAANDKTAEKSDEKPVISLDKFTDIKGHWAKEAIEYALQNGLMVGTSERIFSPEKATSRGMAAVVLYRLAGEPETSASSGFEDVTDDAYYAKAVTWAAANGIVNGYTDTKFAPDKNITREQFAAMLYRFAKSPAAESDLGDFADSERISAYAKDAFAWAIANKIITGGSGGALNPQGQATRAEMAAMLMRYCENVGS